MPIFTKFISSMEKCFLDEKIDSKKEIKTISMLRNERLSFEFAYTTDTHSPKAYCDLRIESPFGEHLKLFKIEQVPGVHGGLSGRL